MSLAAQTYAARATLVTPRRVQLAVDLLRYGACSAAALALDYGLLLGLAQGLGVHYLVASAAGFLGGLTLAYGLSIAFVFKGRRRLAASKEFTGFAAIGAAGLVLTQILLACLVGGLGLPVAAAKAVTAIIVFGFNFGLRRAMLFASEGTAEIHRKQP